jgi:hypothetical protein
MSIPFSGKAQQGCRCAGFRLSGTRKLTPRIFSEFPLFQAKLKVYNSTL